MTVQSNQLPVELATEIMKPATTSEKGLVKPDGTTVLVDSNGTISVAVEEDVPALTSWTTTTVSGTLTYTLSSPTLPSSTPSDYNVFFGAGRLDPSNDYTINTTSNTITLNADPGETAKLTVQYAGIKVIGASAPTPIEDFTSTTISVLTVPNCRYYYGTLSSLTLSFTNNALNGDLIHIMFTSGSTATTVNVSTTYAYVAPFNVDTNCICEFTAIFYNSKWVVKFTQTSM